MLVEVGLIAPRDENRGFYDRFRDRVMFPIRDVRGQTVGFGGRVLPSSPLAARGPKYYNSADTPLFSKSDLLYGLDLARHPGSAAGFLAVVEGYTDVMMAHQCGVANVVATMGTALNARHVAQLRRYAPKVVLVFDSDDAGESATDKSLGLFWSQHDLNLDVTTLPDGLDPCDLLQQPGGADTFRRCLASAKPLLDYKLDALFARHPLITTEDVRQVLDKALSLIALFPTERQSAVAQAKQELAITRLSQRLGLRQETVWARLAELKRERQRIDQQHVPPPPKQVSSPTRSAGPPPTLEKQLLQLLLAEPTLVAAAAEKVNPETLSHTGLRRMLAELYALQSAGQTPDLDALRVRLIDRPDLATAALDLQFTGRHMTDRPEWLKRVVAAFAEEREKTEKQALKEQLAAGPADDEQAVELLRRLQARTAAPSDN